MDHRPSQPSFTVFKASPRTSSHSQPLWRISTWGQSSLPSFASGANPNYITIILLRANISTTHLCVIRRDSHLCGQSSFCCIVPQPLASISGCLSFATCDTTLLSPVGITLYGSIAVRHHHYPVLYVFPVRTYTSSRGRAII